MRIRVIAPVTVLLAVGALAQGCGGGDSSATGSAQGADSGARTAQEVALIRKANRICEAREKKLGVEVGELYEKYGQTPAAQNPDWTPARVKAVTVALVPNLEAEVRELRALGEPSGSTIPMKELTARFEKFIAGVKANPRKFVDTPAPYDAMEKAAEKYGIIWCPVR